MYLNTKKCFFRLFENMSQGHNKFLYLEELDGVGPVDNRPSTD